MAQWPIVAAAETESPAGTPSTFLRGRNSAGTTVSSTSTQATQ